MTKEKSLYQVKLIIDNLSDEEYEKIPEETIKYIEENMEYSEDIVINPDIPLENQKIDEKTYDFLNDMIKKIESNEAGQVVFRKNSEYDNLEKEEIIKLLETYKIESSKIPKMRELIKNYKRELENANKEITKLKSINEELYKSIQKCPRIIRKIFFRNFETNLLK